MDVFSPTVELVLRFLTIQYKKGVSYSSLNSFRSAISQLSGPEIGQDFRIKRFFRGVYHLRPSRPKYDEIWDPNVVLDYIRSIPEENISLEMLTHKLATLMILATGQRVQTINSVNCSNIVRLDDRIEIRIPKRLKTSGKNKFQPTLILPFCRDDPVICVAKTLMDYLDKTKNLRGLESCLFITTAKPHKAATTQTLSRWIKTMLGRSGVDVAKFTAHSTRHASTSAAARKGINIDTICRAAGWTRGSKTFASFYNRPLSARNNFAEAILSTTDKLS